MDLYSAASRLSRPFLFGDDDRDSAALHRKLGIGARGIIGDGLTCALVRVDGAIDWCCMPRFDSPSVFGSLLDPERGGVTSIMPVQRPFETLQRYDPDTNVLETLFEVHGRGVLRLTDFMPWTAAGWCSRTPVRSPSRSRRTVPSSTCARRAARGATGPTGSATTARGATT